MAAVNDRPPLTGVILAAGDGGRFIAAGGSGAKCLTTQAGIGPLPWTIQVLTACGLNRLIIVTGKYDHDIREAVAGLQSGAEIQFIRNMAWEQSDTAFSFALAAAHVTGAIVLTYADVYLRVSLVDRLLQHHAANVVAIEGTSSTDGIDMRVQVTDGAIVAMAKDLPDRDTVGESACLFRLDPTTARLLSTSVLAGTNPTVNCQTVEDLLTENADAVRAVPLWCGSHEWCEVDFPSDLRRAKTLIDCATSDLTVRGKESAV